MTTNERKLMKEQIANYREYIKRIVDLESDEDWEDFYNEAYRDMEEGNITEDQYNTIYAVGEELSVAYRI